MIRPRLALVAVLLLCPVVTAHAQTVRDDMDCANGRVWSAVVSGNTLYIGGEFTRVGPATGSAVPVDAVTGLPPASFPRTNGAVTAVVPDGAGGWFIGGGFTEVDGIFRLGIARLNP